MKNFDNSWEDAQVANKFKTEIKEPNKRSRFIWKLAIEMVHVCVCICSINVQL